MLLDVAVRKEEPQKFLLQMDAIGRARMFDAQFEKEPRLLLVLNGVLSL